MSLTQALRGITKKGSPLARTIAPQVNLELAEEANEENIILLMVESPIGKLARTENEGNRGLKIMMADYKAKISKWASRSDPNVGICSSSE